MKNGKTILSSHGAKVVCFVKEPKQIEEYRQLADDSPKNPGD